MRNIEEIKADINLCTGCMTNRHDCDENCNDCLYINYDKNYYRLRQENYNWYKDRDSRAKAISGIKTSRLEEICNAESDGRCVVLPCKIKENCFVVSHTDKTITEITVSEFSYSIWHDAWVVAAANGHQFFLDNAYRTRAEAEAAMKGGTA